MTDKTNMVLMNLAGPSAASKTTTNKSSKAGKTNETKDDNSFKAMLDKNAQKDTAEKPVEGEKQTEEKPVETKKDNSEEVTLTGMNAESVVQLIVLPEQERANINWGEAVENSAPVEAVAAPVVTETDNSDKVPELVTAQEETPLTTAETVLSNEKTEAVAVNTDAAAEKNTDKVEIKADKEIRIEVETEVKPEQHVEQNTENKAAGENTDQPTEKQETKTEDVTPFAAVKSDESQENMLSFKVGDAVDMTSPKAEENLAETVVVKALERNNEFEIKLQPEELGTIKIRLLFENGKINVSMTCDNQKAVELLSASSGKLRELIQSNTGDETYVSVAHENEAPYYEENQKQNDRRGNQESNNRKNDRHDESSDFIQQLRLGLVE